MSISGFLCRACLLPMLALLVSPVVAQDGAPMPAAPAEDAAAPDESAQSRGGGRNSIRIELVSPVGAPVQYFIGDTLIARVTALDDIEIRHARMTPLGRTGRLYGSDENCKVAGVEKKPGDDGMSMGKGEQTLVTCELPFHLSPSSAVFALLSSAHSAAAMIEVEVPSGTGDATASSWIARRVDFVAAPLFVSALFGGMAGAFVLAALAWALDAKERRAGFAKTVVLGSLTAMVLIIGTSLFSAGAGIAALPINVSVGDFQGGLLVGLLAFLLREPIAKRLGISSPPATQDAGPAPTPPGETREPQEADPPRVPTHPT